MRESVRKLETGSIELLVVGLLAALIIVLAVPVLEDLGSDHQDTAEQITEY